MAMQASYKQVYEEAVALARDPDADWPLRSRQAGQLFARQLGMRDDWLSPHSDADRQAAIKFRGLVMRVLNQLVAGGVLRKVKKGGRGPDGRRVLNEAQFWTPAAWKRAEAERMRWEGEASARSARWAEVYDDLTRAGYEPVPAESVTRSQARGQEITLDIASWEQLLRRLMAREGL
jgi:hypothetical protein